MTRNDATAGEPPVRCAGACTLGRWSVYVFEVGPNAELEIEESEGTLVAHAEGPDGEQVAVATLSPFVRARSGGATLTASAYPPSDEDDVVPFLSPAAYRVMAAALQTEEGDRELARQLAAAVHRGVQAPARTVRLTDDWAVVALPAGPGEDRTYGPYANVRITAFAQDGRAAATETTAVATHCPGGPLLFALIPVPPGAAKIAVYRASADPRTDVAANCVWDDSEADGDVFRILESFGFALSTGLVMRGLLRAAVAHRAVRVERMLRSQLRTGSYQMKLDRPFGFFVDELLTFPGRGYFVRGWVQDPVRQIAGAYVVPPSGKRIRIELDQCRMRRDDVLEFYQVAAPLRDALRPGFAAFAEDPEATESFVDDVMIVLEGEATATLAAEQAPIEALEKRRRILDAADAADVLDLRRLAPAFAAAQHEVVRNARVAWRHSYEPEASPPPRYSIVVPLYRRIDFVRYQLAEFANDPELGEAEVLYVLDSPEQRVELTELLRSWTKVWPVRTRLLVMERNAGYAAATNAGMRDAQGPVCVLLNSDVFPAAPGWLGTMHRALVGVPNAGIVGPQLIYEDGAIQHAGMYYAENRLGLWSNEHFFKGYPRDFPAANVSRYVPAVTGACMMLRRELYHALGGLSEEYCVGDFEDSDFCNKAAAAGFRAWYESTAVLYHLERQSFGHSAYNHLGWRYNQWLHESRWRNAAERIPVGAAV